MPGFRKEKATPSYGSYVWGGGIAQQSRKGGRKWKGGFSQSLKTWWEMLGRGVNLLLGAKQADL